MTITIFTRPRPKARPRFANGHAYTPATTKDYEAMIARMYRLNGGRMYDEPIALDLTFGFAIPDSWSKAKKLQAKAEQMPYTAKPDIDNLTKAVMDALNGVAWTDDKVVVRLNASKVYSPDDCVGIAIFKP